MAYTIKKYTTGIEYTYKILKVIEISGSINTTMLMFLISNNSTPIFKPKFESLLNAKYIKLNSENKNRRYYSITKTGMEFIKALENIIPFIEKMEPDTNFKLTSFGNLLEKKDQENIKNIIMRRYSM